MIGFATQIINQYDLNTVYNWTAIGQVWQKVNGRGDRPLRLNIFART